MKRILRLERIFISQYLKMLVEYRADFLVGIIGVFLTQGINIVFLGVIFSQIPALNGWNFNQIAFIYGFSLIPMGLDHLLTDNLWAVGQRLVWKGEFDKYMTRPLNPLLHVIMEVFQLDAVGELLVGILLLGTTWQTVTWTVPKALLFLLAIPFAALIYTSLKIAASSLAFWMWQSGSILYIFYQVNAFAKYPMTIYSKVLQGLLSFVIPFAFTAFYPASYFLTGKNPLFCIGGLILVSIIFFVLSLTIWKVGLKNYESAGS